MIRKHDTTILESSNFLFKNKLEILLFLFFIIITYSFFPGLMSQDSIYQYWQQKNSAYTDHHPPIMGYLWGILDIVFDGPQGLLFFHQVIFFISIILIYRKFSKLSFSWLIITIPFLPWVINFSCVLWKDVSMAFSILLVLTLAIYIKKFNKINKLLMLLLILIFSFYAFCVRHNAFFALIPVLYFLIYTLKPDLNKFKISFVILLLMTGMSSIKSFFNYNFLDSEKKFSYRGLMLDDLFYLSVKKNYSLIPGITYEDIIKCSDVVIGGSKIHLKDLCLAKTESYKNNDPYRNRQIDISWTEAVKNNFLDIVKFKFINFIYFIQLSKDEPYYFWQKGIKQHKDLNPGLYTFEDNSISNVIEKYVSSTAKFLPFLFKSYWWIIINFILLWFAYKRIKNNLASVTLLLSSQFYIFSYLPLNVSADFRYIYWSVIATSLAASFIFIEKINKPVKFKII